MVLYNVYTQFLQVSAEREGKKVDGKCLSLTASYVRLKHKEDNTVPVCALYEVHVVVKLFCSNDKCSILIFNF